MKTKHCVDVSCGQWKANIVWIYAVTNEKQALRVGRVVVLQYKV